MNVSERLRALDPQVSPRDLQVYFDARFLLADLVEAIEREGSGVAVIRALGFVGNSHYCPSCLNTFHDDCGQHEPDCQSLAGMLEDEDWPDFMPMRALTRLQEHLDGTATR